MLGLDEPVPDGNGRAPEGAVGATERPEPTT